MKKSECCHMKPNIHPFMSFIPGLFCLEFFLARFAKPPPGATYPHQQFTPVPVYHHQTPGVSYMMNPSQPQHTTVIINGGCPRCQSGSLSDSFTCCGILLAIIFFPVGLVCCYVMREKKCVNCGATFG
ncbi:unnamed protein product [Notodromas monacha]|uniref:Brain protein I3 n=1 Tax=Notodromas monacha TaxID=399045 RepID=A0A7R9GB14_9CRUS|nr:unnamed protein product [Notodromas monacha]CAG0914601.1 unnamed protein product [Notodromas monacha]